MMQAINVRVGRKKTIAATVLVRLLPGWRERIDEALEPGEKLADFLRRSIVVELERRERRPRRRASTRRKTED